MGGGPRGVTKLELVGASRLQATLGRAVDELAYLDDAQTQAGRIIAGRASAEAPRLTGRLASSVQWASERGQLTVSSDLDYAGPQNYGVPAHNIRATLFLTRAPDETESQWLPAYEDNLQQIVNRIQGA